MFQQVETRRGLLLAIPIVVVLALATMSAQTATLYVAPTGTNSATCGAAGSPCATLSYVLSNRVAAGNIVIVNPGTYSDSNISLNASKHQNVTITTTSSVISTLGTFTRGIPAGTDNRPYFSSAHVDISVSGVTLSYLRIRNSSSPRDGVYDGVIGVNATSVTIDHSEIWNGNQGIQVNVKRLVTIRENHIHDLGSMSSSEDTHGVAICGTGTAAAGWSEAITVTQNSIHNVGGDAVQEMTDAYCSGTFNFLVVSYNNLYGNQEQGFDSKGTQDLRLFGNDIYQNGEGAIIATDDPNVVSKSRWEIYGNRIHDHNNYAISWAQTRDCDSWQIHSNLIYNNTKNPQYNTPAVTLCGDANTHFYNNVVFNNTDTAGSNKSGGVKDWGSGAGIVNNIFYNNGTGSNDHGSIWSLGGEDSGTPNYNYVYPTSCGSGSCKTGTNVRSACMVSGNCPGFANPGAFNFQLLAGSSAINAGMTLAAQFSLDFLGTTRGQTGAWDLGAYEFGGAAPAPPAIPTNLRIMP